MAALRNPLIKIEPDPNAPGMGIGYWGDNPNQGVPGLPFDALRAAYEQQQQQRQTSMLASNDVPQQSQEPSIPYTATDAPQAPPAGAPPQASASQQDAAAQKVKETRGDIMRGAVAAANDAALADALAARKYVGGSPGVNPELMRRQGSYVPTQRQTDRQKGAPYDEKAWKEIYDLEKLDKEYQGALQEEKVRHDYAIQKAMSLEAQIDYNEQERQWKATEASWENELTALKTDAQQAMQAKVDPDRFVRTMSWGQKLAAVLSAGFQGAATRGQRNDMLQYVTHMIDNDVAIQEGEIQRKKEYAQNGLARLSQQWGSIQAGKSALRIAHFEMAKQKLMTIANSANIPAVQVQRDQMVNALEIAQRREEVKLRAEAEGTVSQRTAEAFIQPRKATPGRLVPKYEGKDRFDVIQKWIANSTGLSESQKASLTAELMKNTGGQDPSEYFKNKRFAQDKAWGLSQMIGQLNPLRTSVGRLFDQLGIKTENGKVVAMDEDNLTQIGMAWSQMLDSWSPNLSQAFWGAVDPETGEINREGLNVAQNRMQQISGAAFTPKEWGINITVLGQAWQSGPKAFAQAVANLKSEMDRRVKNYEAGAGYEATKMYGEDLQRLENEDQQDAWNSGDPVR